MGIARARGRIRITSSVRDGGGAALWHTEEPQNCPSIPVTPDLGTASRTRAHALPHRVVGVTCIWTFSPLDHGTASPCSLTNRRPNCMLLPLQKQ